MSLLVRVIPHALIATDRVDVLTLQKPPSDPHLTTEALAHCMSVQDSLIVLSRKPVNGPAVWGVYSMLPRRDWPLPSERTDATYKATLQSHLNTCGYVLNAPFALDPERSGRLSRTAQHLTAGMTPTSSHTLGAVTYTVWALTSAQAVHMIQRTAMGRAHQWVLADGNHRLACLQSLGCAEAVFFLSDDAHIHLHATARRIMHAERERIPEHVFAPGSTPWALRSPFDAFTLDLYLRIAGIPIRTNPDPTNQWLHVTPHVFAPDLHDRLLRGEVLPYKAFTTHPKPPSGVVITRVCADGSHVVPSQRALMGTQPPPSATVSASSSQEASR